MYWRCERPCSIIIFVFFALQVSCSTISTNVRQSRERREQASDPLAGSGAMVAATFRATAIAAVRQPVTTAKLGIANLLNRPHELVAGNLPIGTPVEPLPPEAPGTWQFEQMLDRKNFPISQDGTLKFLVDGREFFSELDRQMVAARSSIDWQVFIFDNDDIAVRYADKLKQRSEQVKVQVLFDDLGSSFAYSAAPSTLGPRGFVPPMDMRSYLSADSNVEVRRVLNPWLTCDHTKLFLFDRRTAILGGMNIGREYFSEWHDLMVRVEGPIVPSLAREFDHAWRKAGPMGDFALFDKRLPIQAERTGKGIPLRILRTDAGEGRYEIHEASLLAIRAARKRIWIENPYFAHDEIIAAVQAAARRGVDVRVIIPAAGDSQIMDGGNLATAASLIGAGAKVYRYPKMTHLKVMLCDDWATLGSANIDFLSLRINRELNLSFSDGDSIRALENAVFRRDFSKSKKLRMADTKSPTAGLAEMIADQL
jgi:cardiolipin synthase A/B